MSGDLPVPSVRPETLDDFPMLEGVGVSARRELIAASTRRVLHSGEILITQGAPSDRMFFLLEGRLSVRLGTPDAEPVAEIGPGETVGELGVLDRIPASAFVVAATECRVLEVREDDFWQLTNSSHAFAVNMLLKLASRLRANNATVTQSVEKRQQYERAAMFDGLTGIHNRRWLDETLARMVRRHEGGGARMSLSLLDVDHFKSFNDRYGHAAGDHVLVVVARVLSTRLRPTDLVARYGGEEFVILFPDTARDDAVIAAERVREAIAGEVLKMPDGTALPSVTISMGVAELAPGQTPSALLEIADRAMYEAKQGGRNRVVPA